MKDFLERNFNVLLLAVLYVYLFHAVIGLIHTPNIAPENIAWAREQAGTMQGAMIGLVTGFVVGIGVGRAAAKKDQDPTSQNNDRE